MTTILHSATDANLPMSELGQTLEDFLAPVLGVLPDKRLRTAATLAVQAITTGQSPVITQMARTVAREDRGVWPIAKRFYRFCDNPRFSHRDLLKGLYGIAQRAVAEAQPTRLIIAVDPVNFEKPYTQALEGVSTVLKSTPPGPRGEKRLTPGYPAITAAIVNLPVPALTYANWFSYVTDDFVSENREIEHAIRTTRALFPAHPLCFIGDAGLDDQKIFGQVARAQAEFIIRASHLERLVAVYNDRLDRWETESLADLVATVTFGLQLQVTFSHARRVRHVTIGLGWLQIRLPGRAVPLWMLVAHDPEFDRDLVLLTNIPITTVAEAEQVYTDWRYRPRIEHTYRFDQEDGLKIEDVRVQTLERMRRLFVLVLLATLFVYHVGSSWPQRAVLWLRQLGGKLGLPGDLDGPYLLLAGISAVFVTTATLAFAACHPFPRDAFSYG